MQTVILVLLGLSLFSAVEPKVQQSANVTSLIESYGYDVEVHTVQTDDGYLLTLHHIPYGKSKLPPTKGTVLLQHGLTDASAGWCLNTPTMSLSYILADAGYDVWLGNNRGNGYSMANIHYPPTDSAFWDFCWDQMASYDMPANIDYILNKTGQTKISYIGHSEGTIQAFAALSSNPALGQKLKVFIALAPVAYVGNLNVVLLKFLASIDGDVILKLLGLDELNLNTAMHLLLPELCQLDPSLCAFGGDYIYGADTYMNVSLFDVYTIYEPFPTSVKNIVHWAQSVRAGTFSKFDYGTEGNLQHYGQPTPPPYDLSKYPQNLPTVLFTGGIDGLADPTDVQKLTYELSVTPTVYYRADYGHLDFLLGDKAYQLTYPSVLQELAKYQ